MWILLFHFTNPLKTKWYVILFVLLGWGLSFTVPSLLPIDIASSMYDQCVLTKNNCDKPFTYIKRDVLIILWNVIYWGTTILCWTFIPYLQSYCWAGEFHVVERMKSALRENIIFYLVVGLVCGVFLIMFLIWNDNGDWLGIAIAASNGWGLMILIAMLGFGLISVPVKLLKSVFNSDDDTFIEISKLTEKHEDEELKLSE